MYVDALLTLAGSITGNTVTPQSTFGSGTTVLSANTVDLGSARDVAEGTDLYGRVQIVTAFTGGTSAAFEYITADDAALTTNATVIGTTGAIPVASLTAGTRLCCALNPRIASLGRRYLGMRTVNVGANAAGAIFADIGLEIQDFKAYANGFAVL